MGERRLVRCRREQEEEAGILETWLHDRYIAEHLRSAQFAALAGTASASTGNAGLPFYCGPKHWLGQIVAARRDAATRATPPIPVDALRRVIVDAWLHGQQAFHTRNARRQAHQAHRRHQIGRMLFGATLLMAMLHMLGVGHGGEEQSVDYFLRAGASRVGRCDPCCHVAARTRTRRRTVMTDVGSLIVAW